MKKLLKQVVSFMLIIAMCVSTPQLAHAANNPYSYVVKQSNYVITYPNETSITIDFSPAIENIRNIFSSLADSKVTVRWFDNTSREITTTVPAGWGSVVVSNMSAGINYTISIEAGYYSVSGLHYTYDYVIYAVAGNSDNTATPAPTITTGDKVIDPPSQPETPAPSEPTPSQPEKTSSEVSCPYIYGAVMQGSTVSVIYDNASKYGVLAKLVDSNSNVIQEKVVYSDEAIFYNVSQTDSYGVYVYNYGADGSLSDPSSAYVLAQPKINTTYGKYTVKKKSIRFTWGKVKGASKYIIYARKGNTKKWYKVGSTKKNKYTLKKIKGKKINCLKNKYDIKVVAKMGYMTSDDSCYACFYLY